MTSGPLAYWHRCMIDYASNTHPVIYAHEQDETSFRENVDDHHEKPGKQHFGPFGSEMRNYYNFFPASSVRPKSSDCRSLECHYPNDLGFLLSFYHWR